MTILYGRPADPEAFRAYYYDKHIPIARRMQGLTGWNLSWLDDEGPYLLVAELYAETKDALDTVLSSPEGLAANADLDNFVTGTVSFLTGPEEQVALA
ncbi:EthD family reductase [Leifsonia poae]|uniref:EthD family reductase n=1 Tax=Leifsonia poae TaxID=110933 RepID=UPI003D673BEE